MATETKTTENVIENAFTPAVEETIERFRTLNDKVVESGKTVSGVILDTYEKALQNVLKFETQVADASEVELVSSVAKAHVDFVTEISTAYTKAARSLIS